MSPATKLLRWYRRHGRDLPWRRTRDPYKILVSEIMLQQTQVSRGIEFYDRWLKEFPNWESLAEASNAEVIRAWSGLGYNRRALMLRDIAQHMIISGIPGSVEEWESVRGIGPYTSRAIMAFAFKKRVLPIDTNIRRVLARLLLAIPYPDQSDDEKIDASAEDFLPRRGHYFDVPQALFDLATMHCTKVPDCANCPMKNVCPVAADFLAGNIEVPKRTIKKANERIHRNKKHPDRIYRGRILKLVGSTSGIAVKSLGQRIDDSFDIEHDDAWLANMLNRMIADGLIVKRGKTLHLAV